MHGKSGYMTVRNSNPNIYDRETDEAVAGETGILSGDAVSVPFWAGFTSAGIAASSAAAAAAQANSGIVATTGYASFKLLSVAATTVLGTVAAARRWWSGSVDS